MSGVEVVGVVLGVLPLIISAIEHYNDIIAPIVTHRKYSSVLRTLITEINAQRDIFQNECILILSQFVDQHALEEMLQDPEHDLRLQLKKDQLVQDKLLGMIGTHANQLQGILELINISLNEIYEETKHLPDGLQRPQRNDEPIDMKAWRSHVRQKLKLSLRKDYLNQKITDLRNRNQTFLALCQQIVRFNASWTPAQTQNETQSTEKALGKVEKLRSTSQLLYRHLEKLSSCPIHVEHSANLRLCLETTELYLDAPPKISFEMAITYWDLHQPSTAYQEPILLAIESTVDATTFTGGKPNPSIRFMDSATDQDFEPSGIRRQKSAGLEKKEKEKEAAGVTSHFRGIWKKWKRDDPRATSTSSAQLPDRSAPDLPSKPAAAPTPPVYQDLSTVTDLCTQFCSPPPPHPTTSNCIGYLPNQNTTDRYLVYKHPSTHSNNTATTLSNLILLHRRQQSLPKPSKWRLAGALSLAVLLYHSTSWLQATLKSDDILFFSTSASSSSDARHLPGSLKNPHLHSSPRPNDPSSAAAAARTRNPALTRDGSIKNEILYNLGIILLELEFEDTLDSLILESNLNPTSPSTPSFPPSPPSSITLPQQSLLLKRKAGTQLGTLYGRIVRMCLDCDFGLGLDEYSLEDVRVQKVFYAQVVRRFQERMPDYERIWEEG